MREGVAFGACLALLLLRALEEKLGVVRRERGQIQGAYELNVLGPAQAVHQLGVRRARAQQAPRRQRGRAVRRQVQGEQRGGDDSRGDQRALGLEVAANEGGADGAGEELFVGGGRGGGEREAGGVSGQGMRRRRARRRHVLRSRNGTFHSLCVRDARNQGHVELQVVPLERERDGRRGAQVRGGHFVRVSGERRPRLLFLCLSRTRAFSLCVVWLCREGGVLRVEWGHKRLRTGSDELKATRRNGDERRWRDGRCRFKRSDARPPPSPSPSL